MTLVDAQARHLAVAELDRSLIVEAAAGTGKTRILVERMLEAIRRGVGELGRMVVVTFTEKAAGELKLRVREAIERARQQADEVERERFDWALEQLEEAHIGTIHGFCADLLREYPVQAGVDPDFEVSGDDVVGFSLFGALFQRWFDGVRGSLPPGMRRILRRQPERGRTPVSQLQAAAEKLRDNRDLMLRWTLPEFDVAAEVDRLCQAYLIPVARHAVAARAATLSYLLPLMTLCDEVERADPATPRDWEELEARLWALRVPAYLGRGRRGPERDALVDSLKLLEQQLIRFKEGSGAQLAALLQRELGECLQVYEEHKAASGRLDFMDLLLKVRDLLQANVAVRRQLQQRFTQIFIDEFQDTDPLQAEIMLLLSADDPQQSDYERVRPMPGKLFVVGDPKQSIYRFRRAEVELYERVKRRLTQECDVGLLHLTTSFRAVPDLQHAVNAAFEPMMQRDQTAIQAEYVRLSPYRPPIAGQPALVALPIPEPYGYRGKITKKAVREREPRAVAAWITWLLRHSGWQVSTRQGGEDTQPVQPHHVCLLLRHLRGYGQDLTRPYVDVLEQQGIAHTVVGGRSFFARQEVDALVSALRAVEWPADELSVYATLKGPLFGFDDETLWLFRQTGGRFHTRVPGTPTGADKVLEALAVLGELHPGRNHRPPAETVGRLFAATRCLAGFALRPNGEQAVASLLRVQQLARRFEHGVALSFRAFVQYLESQAEAESADADMPLIEEGTGGVRVMSAHRAKGLEFPVVVLADVACAMPNSTDRLVDRQRGLFATSLCGCSPRELQRGQALETERERAEAVRLLYVAATRARDLLVVPTLPEKPSFDSWLHPLEPAVTARERLADVGPGCPAASAEAVPPLGGVAHTAPGLYRPARGKHQLVQWECLAPPTERAPSQPLKHWELINAQGQWHEGSLERYRTWLRARELSTKAALRPSCQVLAATALAHDSTIFTAEIVVEAPKVAVQRVRGVGHRGREGEAALRFGTLVHAVLEQLDLRVAGQSAGSSHVEQTAAVCGRVVGASPQEISAAAGLVQQTLQHPLMRRAATANNLYREVPLLLRVDLPAESPLLVEGIVDLAFVDQDDALVVVDYKTDVLPPADRVAAYQRQVALYVIGLREATGRAVGGHLLFV